MTTMNAQLVDVEHPFLAPSKSQVESHSSTSSDAYVATMIGSGSGDASASSVVDDKADRDRGSAGRRDIRERFSRNFTREMFYCQCVLIYVIVIACIVNLSLGSLHDNVWIALLSGSIGHLMPAPKLKGVKKQ